MFTKSEAYYDAIYSWKNYEAEAGRIREIVAARQRSAGRALLDVACGTGGHVPYLREHFDITGVDLDPKMIEIARARHAGISFHVADMADVDLGRRFDVVACLFSSIGYLKTPERLTQAIVTLARHLEPGGVLLIEPYFSPESWDMTRRPAKPMLVDRSDLQIVRMIDWWREGDVIISDFHYLIGTAKGVEHFTERHEMALSRESDFRSALAAAGLEAEFDAKGLMGRGLYIGLKPAT
ncbi:MAG TPA: class I SAM-dependent methyltransferase [Hyphomicrobiaceae bacterium]|nr:class I SAM-dependent methyltransferase [Hyphomicrobiaceae bacterium]